MTDILLVVGARPNYMKCFPVYRELENIYKIKLLHTGQHYDKKMNDEFFDELKMPRPDYLFQLEKKTKSGIYDDMLYINNQEAIDNKDDTIKKLLEIDEDKAGQLGEIKRKTRELLIKDRPKYIMVFGDVTSTLACALAAYELEIKIIHQEAGLRSRKINMPEEVNRILLDYITDIFFVTDDDGIRNLKTENITNNVHYVGNTMIDTQMEFLRMATEEKYWEKINCQPKKYIVFTMHRPSNVDNDEKLSNIINDIIELSKDNMIVMPIHHRTKKNLIKLNLLDNLKNHILLIEPLGYIKFTSLLSQAKIVITDSGGVQEETTSLAVPCFTLRPTTERPYTLIENGGTNILIDQIKQITPDKINRKFNKPKYESASKKIRLFLKNYL